jgi:hypothetical protein
VEEKYDLNAGEDGYGEEGEESDTSPDEEENYTEDQSEEF